jgi:hypothetical protein
MEMERKYFTRILRREHVNTMIDQLRAISDPPMPFARVKSGQETFEIKAPDGDVVFAGILHSNKVHYLCRLHKEVWDESW